jgi:hypothetical protein
MNISRAAASPLSIECQKLECRLTDTVLQSLC